MLGTLPTRASGFLLKHAPIEEALLAVRCELGDGDAASDLVTECARLSGEADTVCYSSISGRDGKWIASQDIRVPFLVARRCRAV